MSNNVEPRLAKSSGIVVIVKLTNACTNACKYCGVSGLQVRQELKPEKMQPAQVNLLYQMLFNSKGIHSVDFIWHGGEPLLFGKEAFKKLIASQKEMTRDDLKIRNCIQTNGTLIDDEWASFFKKNEVNIGVSIDGPEVLNNSQRISVYGNSYAKTMEGICILQKQNVPFGALAVITKNTINFGAQKLFDFFIENEMKTFDFLPQEPIIDSKGNQVTDYVYPMEEYVRFTDALFDIWYANDDPDIHIVLFEEIIKTILKKGSNICQIGHSTCANTAFTFYPDNTLSLCDKFPRACGGV